ncbi:hypothetical protein AAKU67_001498 [Oxalobacteraceae bacterium GrIS 2.11]
MRIEFDKYLEGIAISVTQQQGLNFSNYNDAQQHLKKTKSEIYSYIQKGNELFMEGLRVLQEKNHGHVHGYVAGVADKLLKNLKSGKKLKRAVDEVLQNEHSLRFFAEAAKSFYDCGDYHREQCVIAVLMGLFPLNPQPYIYLGSLIWRKDGIAAADLFYSNIIQVIQDPALYYFAADCFYKNDDLQKFNDVLDTAICQSETSGDIEARQHLLSLRNQNR